MKTLEGDAQKTSLVSDLERLSWLNALLVNLFKLYISVNPNENREIVIEASKLKYTNYITTFASITLTLVDANKLSE